MVITVVEIMVSFTKKTNPKHLKSVIDSNPDASNDNTIEAN